MSCLRSGLPSSGWVLSLMFEWMYSLGHFVRPPHVFCPIPFQEWDRVLVPGFEWQFHNETCAIHLWNEMWRRNNCPKDAGYDPACLYEQLKSRYLDREENVTG